VVYETNYNQLAMHHFGGVVGMTDKKHRLSIKNVLSHPFVLLVIGAGISGLLVPYITNQWQNHQKELELKTDLASQISKAVANIIIVSRLVQIPAFAYTNLSYANTFEEWEVSKATIGSQIQSYFPKNQIKQEWDNLSSAITEFSALNAPLTQNHTSHSDYARKLCARIGHVLNLHVYLDHAYPININRNDLNIYGCQDVANQQELEKYSPRSYNIDWRVLVYKDKYSSTAYFKNWLTLEKELQDQKDKLIQTVLNAHISVF
jgi:hypothetical protein